MLATAIVVFRETLEAALIVGIVLAASAGVAGNRRWVGLGVLGGVLGAARPLRTRSASSPRATGRSCSTRQS
jgi:high-affinity iron transporter